MSERILLVETAPFYEYRTHLVEATEDSRFLVVEGTGGSGPKFLEVEGRFQHADLENHNGRIYPKQLWKKVLADPQIIESLEEGSMLGELDHPADGKSSLKNIAHIITALRLNEATGEVTGRARILNNEHGKQLRSIFEAGGKVGISSRGSGSVKPQGGVQVVQEDFRLNTFDFVVQPSTPNAFPKPKNESTFNKSKNESVSLPKTAQQEDRMDSIKRLTDLREQVAELKSEPTSNISKRAKKRLVAEAIALEVEVNRLAQEDSSVATVADDLAADLKSFRSVVEGDKPDFFKKKDDEKKSEKDGDSESDDDDSDDSSDDKKKSKKDDDKKKEEAALADLEKEPTVEEKIAEAIAQRDAAIRQARITYRMAESQLQSTGLVMNALRAKLKALIASKGAVSESTVKIEVDAKVIQEQLDALKAENDQLTKRNQRLEAIINKVQEKVLEAEKAEASDETPASDASVEESIKDAAPAAKVTEPLPTKGAKSVMESINEQHTTEKSQGASLASRALGVMTKVRSSHVQRGDSILESKSSVK